MYKLKNKRIQITWIDSKGINSQWEFLDELESLEPVECISVGFLIEDNLRFKTIASTVSPNHNQVLGRISIPTCSIKKVKELK